jgi:4-hydroxy-3-methylbut-2-enyl diphosphate reductase
MRILIAKHAGFCTGVKQAVSMAFDTIHANRGRKIYTYGELIHNKQVLQRLGDEGVKCQNFPSSL